MAQTRRISLTDLTKKLCRVDIGENPMCHLTPPYYIHTTSHQNAEKIFHDGLRVQPMANRAHQEFDPILEEQCIEYDVYDKACKARENNVFLWSDVNGAIEHSLYMATLKTIDYEQPALILAHVPKRNVYIDPENNRNSVGKTVEEVVREYPEDRLSVTVRGDILAENIVCKCQLKPHIMEMMDPPIDDLNENPEEYGFVFNPEEYGVKEGDNDSEDNEIADAYYQAQNEAIHEFIENYAQQQTPHFGKYYQALRTASEQENKYARYERSSHTAEKKLYEMEDWLQEWSNWDCECKDEKIKT